MVNFVTVLYSKIDERKDAKYDDIAIFKSGVFEVSGNEILQTHECGMETLLVGIKKLAKLYDGIIYFEEEDMHCNVVIMKDGNLTLFEGTRHFSDGPSNPQYYVTFDKKIDAFWFNRINNMEMK